MLVRLTLDLEKLRVEREAKAAPAIVLLNKAIELNPLDPVAFIYLARAYELLEKPDKGAEAFEKAIELGTKESWVFVSLARLYQTLGRKEEALKSYKYVAEKVRLSKDPIAGTVDSDSLEAIWKNFAYRELAAFYVDLGQYEEALATYREIVSSTADDAGIRYRLGLLFLKLGDNQSAEQEYLAMKRIAAGTRNNFSRKP